MKILSYNINRCNQGKIDDILSKGYDIMVLPECTCKEQVKLPEGYSMEWMGIKDWCDWKGLGVIWKSEINVKVAPWFNEEHKYMLPLIVEDKFILLASWPTKVPNAGKTYPQILRETLEDYKEYLLSMPSLICGDFNCYTNQPGVARKTGTFEQCIEILSAMGLHDLYHVQTGEDFCKESRATYYHLFKDDMPFFIDYAFTNLEVKQYELGTWEKDFSDHCPQIVEI